MAQHLAVHAMPASADPEPESTHSLGKTRKTSRPRRIGLRACAILVITVMSAVLGATPANAQTDVGSYLTRGEKLLMGQQISRNIFSGWVWLVMQNDGNLVEYFSNGTTTHPCWASNTWTSSPAGTYAVYQPDGNFVVYRPGYKYGVWASNTGNQGTTVDMNRFGVLYVGFAVVGNDCYQ